MLKESMTYFHYRHIHKNDFAALKMLSDSQSFILNQY